MTRHTSSLPPINIVPLSEVYPEPIRVHLYLCESAHSSTNQFSRSHTSHGRFPRVTPSTFSLLRRRMDRGIAFATDHCPGVQLGVPVSNTICIMEVNTSFYQDAAEMNFQNRLIYFGSSIRSYIESLSTNQFAEGTDNRGVAITLTTQVSPNWPSQERIMEGIIAGLGISSSQETRVGEINFRSSLAVDRLPYLNSLSTVYNRTMHLGEPRAPLLDTDQMIQQCRDLVENHPSIVMEVIEGEALRRLGFGAILSVGAMSPPHMRPAVIRLAYEPVSNREFDLCLLGKGLIYDSGGAQLKRGANLGAAFVDHLGAQVVFSNIEEAASQNIQMNILGLIGVCANLVGAEMQPPRSLITGFGGPSITVGHTDAEGRLVISDLIGYAASENISCPIVSVATMTGDNSVSAHAPFVTQRDDFANTFEAAASSVGELVLRYPILPQALHENSRMVHAWPGSTSSTSEEGMIHYTTEPGSFLCRIARFHNLQVPYVHFDIGSSSSVGTPSFYDSGANVSGSVNGFGAMTIRALINALQRANQGE